MAITNILRVRRRAVGGASGAPSSLYNAELAFSEPDKILYYGYGETSNTAASIISIGGEGAFATLSTDQTITGNKTFTGNTIFDDIAVNGGDLTTTSSLFNLLAQPTTINFGDAATTINIGNPAGITTISSASVVLEGELEVASDTTIGGLLAVNGDSLTSTYTAFNLLNQPEILNIGSSASTINIGASTGTTTLNNNLSINTGIIETSANTASVFDNSATIVYAFGDATTLRLASSSGTTVIGNNLEVDGTLFVGGNNLTVGSSTFSLVDINATTVNAFGAATSVSIGASTGITNINNNLIVFGFSNLDDLTVNGTVLIHDNKIYIGAVSGATDDTADGGGIVLKGDTNKLFEWNISTGSWTSSENVDIASGKTYKINAVDVLSSTTLGTSVVDSSLTSVGTITTGEWAGTEIAAIHGGTGITSYDEGDMIWADTSSTFTKLNRGSAGQILQLDDTDNYVWSSRIDGGVYA